MHSSYTPFSRLWKLVREEKSDISAIYFFAILSGIIQLSLPLGIQSIIGFVLGGSMSTSLIVLIVVLVLGAFITGIMQLNQMRIIEKIQQKIFVKNAFAFTRHIPLLDVKQTDDYHLPELTNHFFDTLTLQKTFAKLLLDLPAATIQILFGLLLLSFYHPFFISFGVLLLLLLWLILYTSGSKGLQSSIRESTYKYSLVAWLQETARLVTSFKFAAGSGLASKNANEKTIGYITERTTHFKVLLLQYKTLIAFKLAITAAMLVAGVILLLNQQINIGQFVAAEIIIITIISAVEKIIVNLDSVYDVLTAVEKLGKLTDKPIEMSGSYLPNDTGTVSVTVSHLSFAYKAGQAVLKAVDLHAAAGTKICIAGCAGTGKTTLLKLIAGMYQDYSGSLLIDAIPVGNYHVQSLRERIGIFFLNENIFAGSLWENLTMGRKNPDQEYLQYLISITGLQAFVAGLPQGFDTQLATGGKQLPANAIHKIQLVRALAHKPALLLLDDPLCGIEEAGKQAFVQFLMQLDATVIMAANDAVFQHRCHQIVYLQR